MELTILTKNENLMRHWCNAAMLYLNTFVCFLDGRLRELKELYAVVT